MSANCHRSSKPSPQSGAQPDFPVWRREYEQSLHRICQGIKSGLERGESLCAIARRCSRRWNGKTFKSDPTRTFFLSFGTIIRLWYRWKRGGEVPAAVRLRYRGTAAHLPAPMVVRFLEFCLARSFSSFKAAWMAYQSRPDARARGSVRYSYGQVLRYFRGTDFRAIQIQLAAIAAAQAELVRLRVELTARIRRQLPDRPARKRRTSAEISLDSAHL